VNSQDTNYTLAVLVADAREGKQGAFREIFEHLHARVFGYILSHTPERDEALDITQEAFVDVWKALRKFEYKSDEEFYGFVFLIVKRKIARFYKARRATVPLDENIADVPYHETEYEDHRFLMKQIQTLTAKYQELLRLRYWGGMKLAEAAAVLGITEGTAKVWHYRALQELKTKVQRL
jgi:RNA polymerase sigma-70 factor (ECF subfamily)